LLILCRSYLSREAQPLAPILEDNFKDKVSRKDASKKISPKKQRQSMAGNVQYVPNLLQYNQIFLKSMDAFQEMPSAILSAFPIVYNIDKKRY